LALGSSGGGPSGAQALSGAPELAAQTDDSVPARDVTILGAAPGEAPGETWGLAHRGGQPLLLRYTPDGGWSEAPALLDAGGSPLTSFQLDQPEGFRRPTPSPLSAQMTPNGAAALAGTVGAGAASRQVVLVRNPGGQFQETPSPPEGAG